MFLSTRSSHLSSNLSHVLPTNRLAYFSSTTSTTFSTKPGFFKRLYEAATSDAKKKERQQQLNSELEDGVFPQFKEYRKTSGKLFRADDELISRGVAPIFPTITETAVSGDQVSVPPADSAPCLIGVAYNKHALVTFEQWRTAYLEALGNNALMYELTITESSVLGMFASSVTSSLKSTVPAEFHHRHVPIFDANYNEKMKESLMISNTIPLYVFLVENSYVRWRGTGTAEDEELESMIKCARQLTETIGSEKPKWQQVGTNSKQKK